MKFFILIFMLLACLACEEDDGCEVNTTRCQDDEIQICDADQFWILGGDDCGYWGEICCMIDNKAYCVVGDVCPNE